MASRSSGLSSESTPGRQAVDGGDFLGVGAQVLGQFDHVAREAQAVGERVARHLIQPCSRIDDRAETLALAHGLEKHILQQVLCIDRVPQAMPQPAA
jgi:hypothetical protein